MTNNNDTSYLPTQKYPVALEHVSISGYLKNLLAELIFELDFHNCEDKNVEILYCFPLPNRAVVTGLEASGADAGNSVSARPDRANDYDRIIEENGAACKLELKEKNLLELALGNVPAGSRMKIIIKMQMPLELDDAHAILRLPFALAPRYVPQTYNWTDNPVPSPLWEESVHYSFQLNLDVDMSNILRIHSPTHKIVSRELNGMTRVSLGFPRSIPDRDLILELRLKRGIEPQCQAFAAPGNSAAGRLIFSAGFESPSCPEKNPEIILMLDSSASMTPRRFEQALEALEMALRALAPGDYFNVVTFGGDCRMLSPTSLPYNRKNLNSALEMLSNAHPNLEGTELLQILKVVDKLPRKPKSRRSIILISDGEVYNTHELIHYIRVRKNNSAIFALMIGSSSGQSPLSFLSEYSGGYCEILHEESSIAETILRQLSRIIQIPVRDVTLSAENAEIETPSFIPAIFEGDVYSLFFKIKDLSKDPLIILEGKLRNRKFRIKTPMVCDTDARLPLLRAASEINILEDSDSKARASATALGEEFKLLTRDAPLLTVHHKSPAELASYYPAFRMVPLILGSEHRRHYGNHLELMAAVHEKPALYGGNFIMKQLAAQQADGTFSDWAPLAEYLGVPLPRLQQQIDGLLVRHLGADQPPEHREMLFALLALKEMPENRLTAPFRRKIMSAIDSLPERTLLLEAAGFTCTE